MLILGIVALLVFGPKKLPEIGKSLGKTIHDLRDAMEGRAVDERPPTPAAPTVTEDTPKKAPEEPPKA